MPLMSPQCTRSNFVQFSLLLASLLLTRASNTAPGGSVLLTKKEFLARCEAAGELTSPDVTCESLWMSFATTFQCPSTDCTPVTDESEYSDFIGIIPPITAVNKTLFYSGSKEAANNIGRKCVHKNTIESTYLGRIFDNGIWCCARNGVMDVSCGEDAACTETVLKLFWTAASGFAQGAKGYPAAVLNGSAVIPPYRNNSIFTTTEVPSLTPEVVVKMTVILAYDDGGKGSMRWTCSSPDSRLDQLQSDLAKNSIAYNCTDDLWFSSEECSSVGISVPCIWLIVWLMSSIWFI